MAASNHNVGNMRVCSGTKTTGAEGPRWVHLVKAACLCAGEKQTPRRQYQKTARHSLSKCWEHSTGKRLESAFWAEGWLEEVWSCEQRNSLLLHASLCALENKTLYVPCK